MGGCRIFYSACEKTGDLLATPRPTAVPALSYSQTSCLPSMFSFFLSRCDGIPSSVSCFERPLLGYSQGSVCRRPGGSFSLPNGPKAGVRPEHNAEQQLPEAHSILLSLSCWSWLRRLHVPKVVSINQERSLFNCREMWSPFRPVRYCGTH